MIHPFAEAVIWAATLLGALGQARAADRVVRFDRKVDPWGLQLELKSAGFAVNYIQCSGTRCELHLPASERKDPLPVIGKHQFVDLAKREAERRTRALELHAKLAAGTISLPEKDELLKLLSAMVLGADSR